MVLGYHVVLGMYGFWLPNDPRGSWSDFVWSDDLRAFGPATKVTRRRSVAAVPHDRAWRQAAKRALKYPPVALSDAQILAAGRGVAIACELCGVDVRACAILREHAHLVIARGLKSIEAVVAEIKQRVTLQFGRELLHPMEGHRQPSGRRHSPWARGFWKVFLNGDADIERSIGYVDANPERDGLPPQHWDFVNAAMV